MVKVQVGLDQRAAGSGDYTATCTMDRHCFVPSARPCQLSDSVIKALSVTGKLASGCRAGELITSFEMLYCLHKAVNYNSQ